MVCFGKRELGNEHPCFIVFEAGATHDGEHAAKQLISLAAKAGADAVKFQIFDPDMLVSDRKLLFSYDVLVDKKLNKTETINEPLYDILCRRSLSQEQWIRVKKHSDSLGLAFFATVGFEKDIQLVETLGCDSIKIASADINHWPLIRRAAQTGMCIQLDTGCATLGEIESAVEVCRKEDNNNIIIHNCPSGYPARIDSINLRLIATLKQMYPEYPIAYSDHTPGWDMDVAALALGVNCIEKTITLDSMIRSPEHLFSLEPDQTKQFIATIRDVEKAMGLPRRILHTEEKQARLKLRRSTFLKRNMTKESLLDIADVEFRRPGFGMAPDSFESMMGMPLTRDLKKGHMLTNTDFTDI